MSEQLYRIECPGRGYQSGDLAVVRMKLEDEAIVPVLIGQILIPANPGTLTPEWEQMLRRQFDGEDNYSVTDGHAATSNVMPGTLEWAREYVKSGGAVWKHHPLIKFTANYVEFANGITEQCPCCQWTTLTGWHPWGDRAWLLALPDGTLVVIPAYQFDHKWTKDGSDLVCEDGERIPISDCEDSGWDLVREPQRYEPDAERMNALAKEYLGTDDESRIDILESHVEQHDHLMADIAARLARLERGKQ